MSTLQTFELLPVALILLAVTAYLAVQMLSPERRETVGVRFALGLIPGIVGVAIVLVSGFDLIPDDAENNLALISVIVVSALLVLGTGYRLARR